MIRLVLFVEEESMRVLLNGLLPHFGLPLEPRVFNFDGKRNLQLKVGDKIRRYVDEAGVEPRFIVMQDSDGADCRAVKARLVPLCEASGRAYRVRIVVQEMEAWMVGDLAAVQKAYPGRKVAQESERARFREPDLLPKPSEWITELTGVSGKVTRATEIGPRLSLEGNRSPSFKAFCEAVWALAKI